MDFYKKTRTSDVLIQKVRKIAISKGIDPDSMNDVIQEGCTYGADVPTSFMTKEI